jgi:hypothetical protein
MATIELIILHEPSLPPLLASSPPPPLSPPHWLSQAFSYITAIDVVSIVCEYVHTRHLNSVVTAYKLISILLLLKVFLLHNGRLCNAA